MTLCIEQIDVTEESWIDLFPCEDVIYLTPDASEGLWCALLFSLNYWFPASMFAWHNKHQNSLTFISHFSFRGSKRRQGLHSWRSGRWEHSKGWCYIAIQFTQQAHTLFSDDNWFIQTVKANLTDCSELNLSANWDLSGKCTVLHFTICECWCSILGLLHELDMWWFIKA